MVSVRSPRALRTIPFLIAFCLIAFPAHAKYSGGTGEPNDPYQIATAADLIALGETLADYDKHFIMTADIDLDPNLPGRKVFDKAVITPGTATPDWPYFQGFTGVFDGNGHTVSNLRIRGMDYLGLFGLLGFGAQVKNLGVVDVNIGGSGRYVGGLVGDSWNGTVTQCYSTGAVSGVSSVGGLVGSGGPVTHCYSAGVVGGDSGVGGLVGFGGPVTHCHSTSAVSGTSGIGGLVGENYADIITSYSTGAVNGDEDVGGLVGHVGSRIAAFSFVTVTQCYSSAKVSGRVNVGGLVGSSSPFADVTQCCSTAAVSGNSSIGGLVGNNGGCVTQCDSAGPVSGTWSVGGLVGQNFRDVTQCYSTSAVSGTGTGVGALVGENQGDVTECFWDTQSSGQAASAGGTGMTTAQMQDPNTFMAAGWDFVDQPDGPHDIWAEPPGGGYPILWWQLSPWPELPRFFGGSGEPNAPYLISTADELNSIGHNPRLMRCHFKLVADLDLADFPFHAIGDHECPYGGTFDGNGHKISHLRIKGGSDVGMFGQFSRGAEVRDLAVVDVNISGTGYGVGALVGRNGGDGASGGIVVNCYSTGAVSGTAIVGGLVGSNYNNGSVTQSYSAASVSGTSVVGGLVGSNDNNGSVTQCYSTGTVSGNDYVGGLVGCNDDGTVSECYSTGAVIGHTRVGGLVGYNWYLSGVIDCFWDIQTSGQATSNNGTGKTTAEMQTARTFLDAGWDFVGETANGTEDIWWILEGKDYPRLWWELSEEANL